MESIKKKKLKEEVNQWKQEFNREECVVENFHRFLQAVQQSASKAHLYRTEDEWIKDGQKCWNQNDSFIDWIDAVLKEIKEFRLPELKKKMKNKDGISRYQQTIMPLIESTSNSKEDEFKLHDEIEVDSLPEELLDYFEWYLHKEMESLKDYAAGKFEIKMRDIEENEIDWELGGQDLEKLGLKKKMSNLIQLSDLNVNNN